MGATLLAAADRPGGLRGLLPTLQNHCGLLFPRDDPGSGERVTRDPAAFPLDSRDAHAVLGGRAGRVVGRGHRMVDGSPPS